MKRKSIEIETEQETKESKDLYIVLEKKPVTVHDFLPEYNLKYEGVESDEEAEAMINSLTTFIQSNEEVVLQEYNSSNIEAVQEGFKRAVAIAELFIRSLYVGGE